MSNEFQKAAEEAVKKQRGNCMINMERILRETSADKFNSFGMQLEEMKEHNKKQDGVMHEILSTLKTVKKQQDEIFPKYQVAKYMYQGMLWFVGTGAVLWGGFVALKDFIKK